MRFQVSINVMPHKELLDPQGKAVGAGLKNLNLNKIDHVRIGKHITLQVDADSEDEAKEKVDLACKKLLSNPVIEFYEFEIEAL